MVETGHEAWEVLRKQDDAVDPMTFALAMVHRTDDVDSEEFKRVFEMSFPRLTDKTFGKLLLRAFIHRMQRKKLHAPVVVKVCVQPSVWNERDDDIFVDLLLMRYSNSLDDESFDANTFMKKLKTCLDASKSVRDGYRKGDAVQAVHLLFMHDVVVPLTSAFVKAYGKTNAFRNDVVWELADVFFVLAPYMPGLVTRAFVWDLVEVLSKSGNSYLLSVALGFVMSAEWDAGQRVWLDKESFRTLMKWMNVLDNVLCKEDDENKNGNLLDCKSVCAFAKTFLERVTYEELPDTIAGLMYAVIANLYEEDKQVTMLDRLVDVCVIRAVDTYTSNNNIIYVLFRMCELLFSAKRTIGHREAKMWGTAIDAFRISDDIKLFYKFVTDVVRYQIREMITFVQGTEVRGTDYAWVRYDTTSNAFSCSRADDAKTVELWCMYEAVERRANEWEQLCRASARRTKKIKERERRAARERVVVERDVRATQKREQAAQAELVRGADTRVQKCMDVVRGMMTVPGHDSKEALDRLTTCMKIHNAHCSDSVRREYHALREELGATTRKKKKKKKKQDTEVEAAEVEAAEVQAAEVEAAEVQAAEVEAAEVEAAEVEAAEVDAAEVQAAEVQAAEVQAAEVEAAEVDAAEVDAAEVEAAQAIEAVRVAQAAEEAEEVRRAIQAVEDAIAEEQTLEGVEEEDFLYHCPLTHERFVDPVILADGHTYEREAVEQWIATKAISPMTNEPLEHTFLVPNYALRAILEATKKK